MLMSALRWGEKNVEIRIYLHVERQPTLKMLQLSGACQIFRRRIELVSYVLIAEYSSTPRNVVCRKHCGRFRWDMYFKVIISLVRWKFIDRKISNFIFFLSDLNLFLLNIIPSNLLGVHLILLNLWTIIFTKLCVFFLLWKINFFFYIGTIQYQYQYQMSVFPLSKLLKAIHTFPGWYSHAYSQSCNKISMLIFWSHDRKQLRRRFRPISWGQISIRSPWTKIVRRTSR